MPNTYALLLDMKALLKKTAALVISASMAVTILPMQEHAALAESAPKFKTVYRTEEFEDGIFG